MSKYCILSLPRTGSTWLSSAIGNALFISQNYINLGEFINPSARSDKIYKLEDGYIKEYNEQLIIGNYNSFVNDRMDMIVNANKDQPTVLKYMYWPFRHPDVNYLGNLQQIVDHGYRIISLDRDLFDCAVSFTVMVATGVSHRWRNGIGKFKYTGDLVAGEVEKFETITLIEDDFKSYYLSYIIADKLKKELEAKANCSRVNYSNMGFDCFREKIPFGIHSYNIKLYDLPYDKLITNYSNLLEIKERIDKAYGK